MTEELNQIRGIKYDISKLTEGYYFIEITTKTGTSIYRFIKTDS